MHSLLTNTGWQGADLRDTIRDQVLFGEVEGKRVTAWGPPVWLEPQMALHVALMLHELSTNSVKYGALSKAEGNVSVTWTINDNVLRLGWVERGGPPVKMPMKRGFGTTLIEQTVKGEGGSAKMTVEADALRWQIALPLPDPKDGGTPITAPSSDANSMSVAPRRQPTVVATTKGLAGKRFLVVEDEPLIALDIVPVLERSGALAAGPVGTVDEALLLIEKVKLDAALLDANLRGQSAAEIAAALTRANVPFVFVTGYGREALPSGFGNAPMLSKPFSQDQLIEAAISAISPSAGTVRLRD
jgi:CheY-like chemotaxis protein